MFLITRLTEGINPDISEECGSLGDFFILASERIPVFHVEGMARNHLTDRAKAQTADIKRSLK